VGIFALVAKCSSTSAPDSKTNAQPEISTAQREAQCKEDLQCWSQKAMIEVGGRCQRKIEKFAKYSVRWTDKTLESKFSRVAWLDKEKGTLRLIGDKVEFQNGFGAYRPHTYSCAVDPATKAVLDVAVQPGRL
jgi:hypothetical protein